MPTAGHLTLPAHPLPTAGPRKLSADQDLHWLRRLSYGVTPALLDEVHRHGRHAWFDKQLTPGRLDESGAGALLSAYPLASASPIQIRQAFPGMVAGYPEAIRQLQGATLARALFSGRQFFERMVELWWDRLHVSSATGFGDLLPQRDLTLRAAALGNYADLLAASTRDPALLQFLSAATSRGSKPNENLGRELLELHTVGTGSYSEADVHNSALTLTGLSVAADGTPAYNPKYHYVGPVQVMGWSHRNARSDDGNAVIASYLSYLAAHPATATHVAGVIARRFVADSPDPGLIGSMAAAYLANGTSIAATVRAMTGHPAFGASVGQKTHGAASGMLASIRALRCTAVAAPGNPDPLQPLLNTLYSVGAAPMSWPSPEGPPDSAAAVSAATVLARWNLHQALAAQNFPGLHSPARGLLGAINHASPAGAVVDRATTALLHQTVWTADRATLLAFLGRHEHDRLKRTELVPGLLALILDSPYGATR